jgi:hypothetical protein
MQSSEQKLIAKIIKISAKYIWMAYENTPRAAFMFRGVFGQLCFK